ncbi:MAG: hypothetical protein ABI746_04060 [Dermatophilaceae bacterium]
MRRRTVLVAVPQIWESGLVAELSTSRRLEVVRRCADAAELLSAAAAGLGERAIVSTGLRGLDTSFLSDLARHGVRVLGAADPGAPEQERTLRQMGLRIVVRSDAARDELERAVERAADAPESNDAHAQLGLAPDGNDPRAFHGMLGEADVGMDPGPSPSGPDRAREAQEGAPALPLAPRATSARAHARGGSAESASGWRPRDAAPRTPRRRRRRFPDRRGSYSGKLTVARAQDEVGEPSPPARLVTVWGPTGAPGRSTVALGLASEAACAGLRSLLIDADPYGGVQAQALSVLDEGPGLAAAVRAADTGALDVPGLLTHCRGVSPRLSILTGISRADRWPELRADPLERVFELSRAVADVVVVDCGFCLEEDEELSYDTLAPRRNAATLAALRSADHLVIVGAGDPVGLQRLTRGLSDIDTLDLAASRTIAVNRVRASAVGPRPEAAIAAALKRFAGARVDCFIPQDRATFDRALLAGRTLAECAPGSPARRALVDLTVTVLGSSSGARRPAGPARDHREVAARPWEAGRV